MNNQGMHNTMAIFRVPTTVKAQSALYDWKLGKNRLTLHMVVEN